MRSLLLPIGLLTCLSFVLPEEGPPPGVKDTKTHTKQPPSPEEAVKLFKPMDGFNVTLFAGEPHVCQPISLAFDDRGRLWVAECYSYPRWHKDAPQGKDRILIFEDTDGDGKFDKRTVFQDNLDNLTSVVIGHGGVWALCAPNLLFFPVKDGEDRPAGKPQIMLDGWTLEANHNIVNNLTWGPDGWLYGLHGILKESKPGVPGTPDAKRPRINCGVWRYHPTRHLVEAVCHGTTNPWGLDFDEHGEGYFTNCVIGHLWHMIPGAHYKRMFGLDYNRYAYELIDATSEHLHWAGGNWTESRTGKAHSDAGGGHAHSGCMVYLGDTFPAEYHNRVFMCNIHGHRLNVDRIERKGNSYVGKRAPDFLKSDDEWFRGVNLTYGPDGAVYVADWCDLGECHDHDGTHRSSGRIYRVQCGKPEKTKAVDLRKKSTEELVKLALDGNEWHSRRARLLLSEVPLGKQGDLEWYNRLRESLKNKADTRLLRVMWTLNAMYGTEEHEGFRPLGTPAGWLLDLLKHKDEHVRAWAVRLLTEQTPPYNLVKELEEKAIDPSGLVRLSVASALQRLTSKDCLRIGGKLAEKSEDANDRVQPLMIWYGIEPAVAEFPEEGLKLAVRSKMPKLRQFIARRIAEIGQPEPLNAIVVAVAKTQDADVQRDLLQGLRDGLKGSRSVKMPHGWRGAYAQLSSSSSSEVRRLSALLALQFDDADALAALRKQMSDTDAATTARIVALQALVEKAVPDLVPQLVKLLDDRTMRGPALRALAAYGDAAIPKEILRVYPKLGDAEKQDAISTLASRPAFALALLDALEKKQVPRADVTPFTARQMADMKSDEVKARIAKAWGQIRKTSTEKKALIENYKKMLTPGVLAKADLSAGRLVFNKTCAQCHMLFGEGHKIGPDLTGSDRGNLHYILENSVDPSAVIGNDYRLTNIITGRGRQIAGIIVEETERAVTVQTATEKILVPKIEIEDRNVSNVSMMPEGQLEKMSREELRDLVGYLAGKTQVPLPK